MPEAKLDLLQGHLVFQIDNFALSDLYELITTSLDSQDASRDRAAGLGQSRLALGEASVPGERAPRIEREGHGLHLRVAGPEEHECLER